MRRTYWYHEECLSQVETAVRTSKSPHHEICAKCGYEGLCVEAELVTNPDVRKIKVGQELKKAAEALTEVPVEAEPTEETEAVEEAVTEAVTEDAVPEEKQPEETVPEAEPEPSVEEVTVKVKLDTTEADAQIKALEAEIEALKKGKK